jgi:hypothetical protein
VRIAGLTYIELGIHEELVAYVADQQNYHQHESPRRIRDGCACASAHAGVAQVAEAIAGNAQNIPFCAASRQVAVR